MRIKSDKISGVEVEIHATENGYWQVRLPGDDSYGGLGQADTLEKAKQQARTALAKKKVKVSVPFTIIWHSNDTAEARRGTATGIHAKSYDVLVRYADGEADTIGSYGTVFRDDVPQDVIDRYILLSTEMRKKQVEMRTIENQHKLDLKKAVREAIEAEARRQEAA